MRRPRVSFVATRSIVRASGFAFLIVAAAATTSRDGQPAARARALALDRRVDAKAQAQLTTAKAPLVFEPNRGQTASDVAFLARQQGYTLGIRATGARVQLKGGPRLASNVLELELVGASSHSRVEADERLPGHSNYFIGNVPAGYLRDVPHFGKVAVREVYPGIDLVYHGKQARVEYDFIVAPGGDLQRISLRFRGQASMNVSTDGDLVFRWGSQELRQQKPVLYQLPGREPVQGRFVMKSADTVGFEVDGWNRATTLVIDPVLFFGSYLGGTGRDTANAVAVDASGDIYVGGTTFSTDFPRVNAFQNSNGGGGSDAFVTKFNPSGTTVLYSTYIGGTQTDEGRGIAVDSAGSAYLAGRTDGGTFPTTASPINTCGVPSEAFLTKLTPAGNALSYSLCFGTAGTDWANAVAVDGAMNAYVTGFWGGTDAFVHRVNATGTTWTYQRTLGGVSRDEALGIGVDADGNVCVAGQTQSTNFPVTVNALQKTTSAFSTAFVAKYTPAGSVVFATYLGGSGGEAAYGAAIDAAGNCYVTGSTSSSNFPVKNAAQPTSPGGGNAFVTAYNTDGTAYLYSTYLGGLQGDTASAIAVTPAGVAHIVGQSSSFDFPVSNPVQPELQDFGSTYVSTNAAASFSRTALAGVSVRDLAVDPTNAQVLYAGTTSGIYKTTNGGGSWARIYAGLPSSFETAVTSLAIDPNAACTIYAGIEIFSTTINTNAALVVSTNCGTTWNFAFGVALTRTVRSLAMTNANPSTLYWTEIRNTSTTPFETHGIGRTTPGGFEERYFPGGFNFTVAIDPANACTAYAGQQSGQVLQNASCTTFDWTTPVGAPLVGSVTTIAVHPTNQLTLLVGTGAGYIYRKLDGAGPGAWSQVAALPGTVSRIVYQPGNPSVVYAGSSAGIVYKSIDGGASWLPAGIIGPAISSLAVSAAAAPGSVWAGTYLGSDAFYTRLSATGVILDSTLLGGHGTDAALGVAVDSSGNAVIVGTTIAPDFPTTGGSAYRMPFGGGDSFVVKLGPAVPCTYSLSPPSVSVGPAGGAGQIGVIAAASNCAWTAASQANWITITGASSGFGSGAVSYTVAANPGSARRGTLQIAGLTVVVTQAQHQSMPGDFDGDGKTDVTIFRPSTGQWFVRQSSTFTPLTLVWGGGADQPVAGDYDGDGITDVAIFRPSTGEWFVRQSSTFTLLTMVWGGGSDIPVQADYDGDGKTDVAIFRPSTGEWFIRQSSNFTLQTVVWGGGSDIPVQADYDGDGRTDVAIFRPPTGEWFVRQSSTFTLVTLVWGGGSDKPVAGDYDGDGKADVAVFRASTGEWFVRQSTTFTLLTMVWGGGSDIPVPGDYDGDGKFDVAIFRPSTGEWFVRQSSTFTLLTIVWGGGTDIPILKRP